MKIDTNKKKTGLILLIIWIIFIWGHSLCKGENSTAESSFWLELVNSLFAKLGIQGYTLYLFRKTAHFIEFFVLGILLTNEYAQFFERLRSRIYLPFIAGIIVAIIDESIQLFVPGRIGAIKDVCIDFSGVCVGVALCCIIIYNIRNKISGKKRD